MAEERELSVMTVVMRRKGEQTKDGARWPQKAGDGGVGWMVAGGLRPPRRWCRGQAAVGEDEEEELQQWHHSCCR